MSAEQLAQLFERQARRWGIERREGMPLPRGPVVAFSRLPGSGGDEIARQVAEWLDYGLFGIEIIDRIARDPALLGRLEADLAPPLRAAIEARVALVFASARLGEDGVLRQVVRVVTTLGERGMAGLPGRGAGAILPAARPPRVPGAGPPAGPRHRPAGAPAPPA